MLADRLKLARKKTGLSLRDLSAAIEPVADRFLRILLLTGNETDRAEAYRAFRGRDPDVSALLKKRGFPTE